MYNINTANSVHYTIVLINTCSLKMSAFEAQDVGAENQIIVILLINSTLLQTAESHRPFSWGINPSCSSGVQTPRTILQVVQQAICLLVLMASILRGFFFFFNSHFLQYICCYMKYEQILASLQNQCSCFYHCSPEKENSGAMLPKMALP